MEYTVQVKYKKVGSLLYAPDFNNGYEGSVPHKDWPFGEGLIRQTDLCPCHGVSHRLLAVVWDPSYKLFHVYQF